MNKYAILLAILLAGCATPESETVYLAKSGQRVQCGPYKVDPLQMGDPQVHQAQVDMRLRQCVSDFQRQGYERVQGP